MPPKVFSGSEAGAGLLAKVLVDKGEDHLPLERQQRRLEREGLSVPITTLTGWWEHSAELLRPLHNALIDEAMNARLPQVDGTGLDLLERDHPKGLHRATLWTAVGGRSVAFVYTHEKGSGLRELFLLRRAIDDQGNPLAVASTQTHEAETLKTDTRIGDPQREDHAIDNVDDVDDMDETTDSRHDPHGTKAVVRRVGPIQCDGENIFGSTMQTIGVQCTLVNCWMHARRYFDRAMKARDLRATVAMVLIGKLYDIERRATLENVDPVERGHRRQAESWPLLEELRVWIETLGDDIPPSLPLRKAIRYVQRRWLSLCVFVVDGRIPIDNGEVERAIRRIGVGRHNWLFTGSDAAGTRLCTVLSLCATCRKLGIEPWEYFQAALLAAGSGMSAKQFVEDFTPWAWAEKKIQQANAKKLTVAQECIVNA
jgi:hypothetical protein